MGRVDAMKTTTKKYGLFTGSLDSEHNNDGDTIRRCENGKVLYIIWSDGSGWFYAEDGSLPMELDRTGSMRKWNGKLGRWVEVYDL